MAGETEGDGSGSAYINHDIEVDLATADRNPGRIGHNRIYSASLYGARNGA